MREIRTITVAVPAELYRQTRKIAADYDTTVTAIVAGLLQNLPRILETFAHRPGEPKKAPQPKMPSRAAEPAVTPSGSETSSAVAAPDTAAACQ